MINYIWNGKHPWLRNAFLQRPKQTGGMALPNFQYDYWAANFRSLVYWVHFHLDDSAPVWVTMESSAFCLYLSSLSLSVLLSAALPLASAIPNSNPVIKHSNLYLGRLLDCRLFHFSDQLQLIIYLLPRQGMVHLRFGIKKA